MNKPLVVRDSKIILAVSVICTAFFVLCLILSTCSYLKKQDMESLIFCALVFGSLTLLGLLLIVYCLRRKLIIYDDHITYTPSFGHTRSFSYSEIRSVVQKREKFIFYSYDGAKLAVIENNMPAFSAAIYLLSQKYVKIIPQMPSSSDTAFNRKMADWNERMHLTDKNAYLRSRYSPGAIQKQKKIIRVISIALIPLSLLAVLLPTRWMISVLSLILLYHYFLFLFFYPKMTLENAKNCDEYHIPFPMASLILCLLILVHFIQTINMDEDKWIPATAVLLLVFLIPLLLMLCIRKIKEHPLKLLSAVITLFFLSFVLTPSVVYTASRNSVHDTVTVLDKSKYNGSYSTSYDLIVVWRGREQKMDVSASLYNSVDVGDTVRVCVRKGILGMEVWQVHQ